MSNIEKNNLQNYYKSTYYQSDVDKIAERTGLSKEIVKKSLSVFRIGFKKYIKSNMPKPFRISKVFTIYKRKNTRTAEEFKNWRKDDRNLPYKK